MKHTFGSFGHLGFICFWLVSLANDLPAPPKPQSLDPASHLARGLVWRVEGGKTPVYLVGSFHLLREKDVPYPASIERAYRASEQVWFEIEPAEMEKPEAIGKMMAAGALPADQSLQDVVSAKTFRKVERWASDPTVKLLMGRMKPWMATLTVTLFEYQKMGAEPRFGVERAYQDKARKDAKPTGGLETVDLQISLFSGFTREQQDEMLSQTFDELAESRKKIAQLIKTWRDGDTEMMAKLIDEGFQDHTDLRKLLLHDRNERWIEQIEGLLEGTRATMVIVGAGHLCGEHSVVDILHKKGWKLTRIEPR
ncbi:MAG: TraB/GumN family protein [Verrucomicrobiales bacterium]